MGSVYEGPEDKRFDQGSIDVSVFVNWVDSVCPVPVMVSLYLLLLLLLTQGGSDLLAEHLICRHLTFDCRAQCLMLSTMIGVFQSIFPHGLPILKSLHCAGVATLNLPQCPTATSLQFQQFAYYDSRLRRASHSFASIAQLILNEMQAPYERVNE